MNLKAFHSIMSFSIYRISLAGKRKINLKCWSYFVISSRMTGLSQRRCQGYGKDMIHKIWQAPTKLCVCLMECKGVMITSNQQYVITISFPPWLTRASRHKWFQPDVREMCGPLLAHQPKEQEDKEEICYHMGIYKDNTIEIVLKGFMDHQNHREYHQRCKESATKKWW